MKLVIDKIILMRYKITATRLLEAKCEAHGAWSINYVCSNVLYSRLAYLFNCGENKKPKMHHFGATFRGITFTQKANNFQI